MQVSYTPLPIPGQSKVCTKCGVKKPATIDWFRRDRDGLRSVCKTCIRRQDLLYYHANSDRYQKYKRKWINDNRGKVNATEAQRYAAKLQRTPSWLTQSHRQKIQSFYIDAERIRNGTGMNVQVDHIIPMQGENVCGLHVPWNLQIITAHDNRAKKNKFDGGW